MLDAPPGQSDDRAWLVWKAYLLNMLAAAEHASAELHERCG
jgi:hypothetical protein